MATKRGVIFLIALLLIIPSALALTIKDVALNPKNVEIGKPVEISVLVNTELKILGAEGYMTFPDGSSTSFSFETKDGIAFSYFFDRTEQEGGYKLDVVVSDEKESTKAFIKFEVAPIPEPIPTQNTTLDVVKNDTGKILSILDISQNQMNTMTSDLSQIAKSTNRATMYVHGTEYITNQTAKLWLQLINSSGLPIDNAVCYLNIYTPENILYVDEGVMTNLFSDGIYYYDIQVPTGEGVYPVVAICYFVGTQEIIYPPSIEVTRGTPVFTNLESAYQIDGNYFRYQETTPSPRQIDLNWSYSNGNFSRCANISEAQMRGLNVYFYSTFNSVDFDNISIEIFNWTSNSWLLLPNRILEGAGYSSVSYLLETQNITKSGVYSPISGVKVRTRDTNLTDGSNSNFDIDMVYVGCVYTSPQWELVRGSSEMHITISQLSFFNQILDYLQNTIYPYLVQLWNKLLGIETQLNITIAISNQTLNLTNLIKNDTSEIILSENQTRNLIINATTNLTSLIADLRANTTAEFNITRALIQSLNLTPPAQNNSDILALLQAIQNSLNTTQNLIININGSLGSQINDLNSSITIQINNSVSGLNNSITQIGNTVNQINETVNVINNSVEEIKDILLNLTICLNSTEENLHLEVTAPALCLLDTNWVALARVSDEFGVTLNPSDGVACNMTTDIWGVGPMSFDYVKAKYKYIHLCDPDYTTFNWSVSCAR
jgi:hypothetical protein